MKADVLVEDPFDVVAQNMELIGLEEMNLRGSLQTRKDRKYLVTSDEAASLLEWIASSGQIERPRLLSHDGTDSHRYASTYFDTPDLRCYTMGLQRARRRFKARTRTYVDSNLTFLEVKTKSRVGTVKHRIPWDEPGYLGDEGMTFVKQKTEARASVTRDGLVPSLETAYCRTTLHAADTAGVRVTFDRNLHWYSPTFDATANSDWWTIETKTSGPVSGVDRRLWAMGHRPQPVSKYMVGIAQFFPDLPAQRWTRALSTFTDNAH